MTGKIIFKHGVMEAGKSAELLMKNFLFKQKNKKVVILKPSLDTRDSRGVLTSRVGIEAPCIMVEPDADIGSLLRQLGYTWDLDVILVDEAQFLQPSQVESLARLVDANGLLCIAYGLKNDFAGRLFPATQRFIELADRIDESPSMCECGRKATMHVRLTDSTEQVVVGDTDIYKSVCRPCFFKLTGTQ